MGHMLGQHGGRGPCALQGQARSWLGYLCICCRLAQCLLNKAMPSLPCSLPASMPQFPHLENIGDDSCSGCLHGDEVRLYATQSGYKVPQLF